MLVLVGVTISLVGWFAFDSLLALVIGTALYIIASILDSNLNSGAIMFETFLFFVGGGLIAFFSSIPFYVGGMITLNCYGALMFVIPMIIVLLRLR